MRIEEIINHKILSIEMGLKPSFSKEERDTERNITKFMREL